MYKKVMIPVLVLVLLLTACSAAAPTSAPEQRAESAAGSMRIAPAAPMAAPEAGAPAPVMDEAAVANAVPGEPAGKRIVLMNADLSIVVADPTASMAFINQMATDMGGFVVSSNLYKTRTEEGLEVPEASIIIRVPAERLTEAMDKIKGLVPDKGTDIISENVSGQDVTREYTDLKSRLANQEQTVARLKEIMASATKTQDVLEISNQISQVNEQIETLKGQIKYYDEAASLSAISVRLQSVAAVQPLSIGTWQPVGVARDALQALVNALKFLVNLGIWAILFILPLIIFLAIPVVIIWKLIAWWSRKRKAKKAATLAQTPPTPPASPAEPKK